MWNAWTAPPGALPRDYDPWSCEAHCARCGELAQDCHCEDDDMGEQTWQPIETAPKDGTRLLTYGRLGLVIVAYDADRKYQTEKQRILDFSCWRVDWDGEYLASEPTHWMPLPVAPGKEHTS